MPTLLEQIYALPESAGLIAAKDDETLAALVSVGRRKPNTREIGNGTILETIGLTAGNALLDVINTAPDFRHVKPLVEQGRLVISSSLVQATVQGLVGLSVLTQGQADDLCALGFQPDPVTALEVRKALWDEAGNLREV